MYTLTCPKIQFQKKKKKKAEVLKVSRDYYVKEIDLLIQKHMLEEQRTAKTLPGDGGIGGQYYCTSELPC